MKSTILRAVFGFCVVVSSACGGSETPGKVMPIIDEGERKVGGPAQSMPPDAGEAVLPVVPVPDAGPGGMKVPDMGGAVTVSMPRDMGGGTVVAVDTMPVVVSPPVPLSQGTMCRGDSDCKSGFCTDGVCCNEECKGTCRSCKGGGGQPGVCLAAMSGTDPDNECGNSTCSVSSAGAAMCIGMCKADSACKTGFRARGEIT